METRRKSFPVFDCDSHIVEPGAIWDEYVPKDKRAFVKSHFYNPLVEHIKVLNGRAYPYSTTTAISSTSSWVPGRSSAENRELIGSLVPGTPEYDEKGGQVAATWNPRARLKDMDMMGIDQVMIFPSHMVYMPLVRDPQAATLITTAYNDWAYDYAQADPHPHLSLRPPGPSGRRQRDRRTPENRRERLQGCGRPARAVEWPLPHVPGVRSALARAGRPGPRLGYAHLPIQRTPQ